MILPLPRIFQGARRLWLGLALCLALALAAALALHRPAAALRADPRLPLNGRWVRGSLAISVSALLADPHHAATLLAGTADGIWRSGDGGTVWRRDGGSPACPVFALAATSGSGTILAGSSDGRVYAETGVTGAGWRPISPALGPDPVFALAMAPDGRSVLAGTLGGVYRGQEVGNAWQWHAVYRSNSAPITSIVWAPWDPRLVFATVFDATPPVLASRDGGLTWHPDDVGLPAKLPTQSLLAGGATTREIVLSTMGGGVWLRAANGGWHEISAGLPQRHAMPIAGDPGEGGTLFAGTMGSGVYERQGSGDWRPLGHGLHGTSALILALIAPSATQSNLLAGTGRGLFRYLPSDFGAAPDSRS